LVPRIEEGTQAEDVPELRIFVPKRDEEVGVERTI